MKKFLIIYYIFVVSFLTLFSSGFMDSQDGLQYLTIARRIYYDQTIEMPDATYDDRSNIHFNTIKSSDDKRYAPTGIGYSLALVPAVALEDLFLKVAGIEELKAFPLENDWPVLLFASMTNSFFGALFITTFYYLLRLLKVQHKKAVFLSFFTSVASSILIYSKHTFGHMMFVSFMFLSFTFVKKYSIYNGWKNMLYSGLAFGVMLISYNSTFLFVIPAFCIYYFILNYKIFRINTLKFFVSFTPFFLGVLPFYLLNYKITTLTRSAQISHQFQSTLSWLKPYVIFEGFWGVLFSPGKSLFLFAPILLVLLIFWHKLSFKKYKAEIITAVIIFITYLYFIGTLLGNKDFLLWHGDSSFGNRYMLAVIPFFLVLVSLIYLKLSKRVKFFIFYPILIISFLVQLVGVSLPYQVRFGGLQGNVQINGRYFDISEYGNMIPRYSPLLSMSKKVARKILDLRLSSVEERNQLKFYDGFGYPFGASNNYWRSMEEYSLLKIPTNSEIALKIVNHQIMPTSTYSAQLTIKNDQETTTALLAAGDETILKINSNSEILYLNRSFVGTSSASIPKEQVLFITQAWVNDEYQNLNSIDYPYVSPISKSLFGTEYYYWGKKQNDPWSLWHMHSGVYEKTFDFWWLRPFQYWDLPKDFFLILIIINLSVLSYSGYKVIIYRNTDDK